MATAISKLEARGFLLAEGLPFMRASVNVMAATAPAAGCAHAVPGLTVAMQGAPTTGAEAMALDSERLRTILHERGNRRDGVPRDD